MEKVTLNLPGMWADHHVLIVRDILGALPGVADIQASARDMQVTVSFDPTVTNAKAIADSLAAAGYSPDGSFEVPKCAHNKPEWANNPLRMTTTYQADLTMAGDFRRY